MGVLIKNMKWKNLLSILLIILSTFALVGCADIQFVRAIDSTETIQDKIAIEFDESKLNKKGIDLHELMEYIDDEMNLFAVSVEIWKNQFNDHSEIKEMIKTGITVDVGVDIKSKKATLTITFANWQMFGLFYGYSEVEDYEYEQAMQDVGPFVEGMINNKYQTQPSGLFFIKYAMLNSTSCVEDIKNFEFQGINYYEKYKELTSNKFDLEDISFAQVFAFPDDRLYSNADDKEVLGDLTTFIWEFDGKSEDFQMQIYKITPNTTWWYIIALVISAISVIVLFIVIYRKYRNVQVEKLTRWDVERNE